MEIHQKISFRISFQFQIQYHKTEIPSICHYFNISKTILHYRNPQFNYRHLNHFGYRVMCHSQPQQTSVLSVTGTRRYSTSLMHCDFFSKTKNKRCRTFLQSLTILNLPHIQTYLISSNITLYTINNIKQNKNTYVPVHCQELIGTMVLND